MREVAGRTLNVDQVETGFRFILGRSYDEAARWRPPPRLHRRRQSVLPRLSLFGRRDDRRC